MSNDLKSQIKKRNKVRQFRMIYSVSQEQLALWLGISQPHLSRVEREISPITDEMESKIRKLENELGG